MRALETFIVAIALMSCGQGSEAPQPPALPGLVPGPQTPAPFGQVAPPSGIAPGDPQVQVNGRGVWPPSGPGCAELVSCCTAASTSDVMLFCQMSVATPPVSCPTALGSVRSYLGERGLPLPAACQAGAGASGSAAGGPAWVQLTMPEVAGWERTPGEDHGPVQGFITEYNIQGVLSVTVYIYNGGVAAIRRDPALLGAQVQNALAGMRQAQQLGRYDAVRELGPVANVTLGSGPNAPITAHQRVMITRGGQERLSETYVTTHRGFFYKLRISLFVDQSPETDARLRALLDQLAATTHE